MAAVAEVTAERRVLRPSMRRVSPDEMQKAAMSVLYSIFAWVRVCRSALRLDHVIQ